MSRYSNDPRVVFNDDGTATIPDQPTNGDWTVRESGDSWIAENPEQGFLHSTINADYPERFRTRDQAIFAIVGEPQ